MISNLSKLVLDTNGDIYPLMVESKWKTGLLNPGLYYDKVKDLLYINIRHVQYALYHSENNQNFNSPWGPLSYIHPDSDRTLRTVNYFGFILDNKPIVNLVDTSLLDVNPIWEFIGLEDARVVIWDDNIWLCGVRRDTTPNGQGRMEMSKVISTNGGGYKEIERYRLDTPFSNNTYCEKNWVPINDKPYHFLKWTNPVEIVKVNLKSKSVNGFYKCDQVILKKDIRPLPRDIRGGSNVIKWGDGYLTLSHEVQLFNSELGQKDGYYYHRFIYFDNKFNIKKTSDYFNFMNSRVEFAVGLENIKDSKKYDDGIYITFGNQDNAAYLLRTNNIFIQDILVNSYE